MKFLTALRRGQLAKYLFTYVLVLLILHWITALITINNPETSSQTWASLFDLDREYNIPTYSSVILFGSCAFVSLVLAYKAAMRIQKLGWTLFSILFGYFAVDEALILHEQLAKPTRELLNIGNSNPLYHAWVVPAIFIIGLLAVITYVISRYHKQLLMFAEVLTYVIILAAFVVLLEILGTFIYSNTSAYRILMVPLEEIFELSMASLILTKLVDQLRSSRRGSKKTDTQVSAI